MNTTTNISEIITNGFSLFFKKWKLFVGLGIIMGLLTGIVQLNLGTNPTITFIGGIVTLIAGLFIVTMYGAITKKELINDSFMKKKSLFDYAASKFVYLILTTLIYFIFLLVVLVILALPVILLAGLYSVIFGLGAAPVLERIFTIISIMYGVFCMVGLSVYTMFTPYVVMLEKKYYLQAIRRSYRLVKGKWWSTFAKIILIQLIAMLIATIILGLIWVIASTIGATQAPLFQLISILVQTIVVLPATIMMFMLFLGMVQEQKKKPAMKEETTIMKKVSAKKNTLKQKKAKKKVTTKKRPGTKTVKKTTKKKVAVKKKPTRKKSQKSPKTKKTTAKRVKRKKR